MSAVKRVACFFTGGYTELNEMKNFMGRINGDIKYIQLCPYGTKRSKDSVLKRRKHTKNMVPSQSGLTGQCLIDHVLSFIKTERFAEENYDAILISDDKDNRFLRIDENGYSSKDVYQWDMFKSELVEKIHQSYPDLPVVFFFSAPEIEAWFVADWNNCFEEEYKDCFGMKQQKLLSHRLRCWVKDHVVTEHYTDKIEDYGYFDFKYRKLSEQIQDMFENPCLFEGVAQSNDAHIGYSKRKNGENMLGRLNPENVLKKCNFYFREGYYGLKNIK